MSYIHEALLKAQKERNSDYPEDQVQVAETVGITNKASWVTLTILLLLISMLFAIIVFSWFQSFQKVKHGSIERINNKKPVVVNTEQYKNVEKSEKSINHKKEYEKKSIVNNETNDQKKVKAPIKQQDNIKKQNEIVIKKEKAEVIKDDVSDEIEQYSQHTIGPGQFLEVSRLYDKGLKYQVQKKYETAITYYQKCLEISPHMAPALNNMGVILLKKKDYQQAKTYFFTAIKESPDYVDPYYNLACLFSQIHNSHQAIEYLKKAVQIYEEARNWAITDSDFEPLYELIEFNKIISGY
jgi:tetratricopeptide (TPR) repeat protein